MTGDEFLRWHDTTELANLAPEYHLHRDMTGEHLFGRWHDSLAEFPEDFERERRRIEMIIRRMREAVTGWEDNFLRHASHRRLRVFHYPSMLQLRFECRCTEPRVVDSIRLVSLRLSPAVQAVLQPLRVRIRVEPGSAETQRLRFHAERRARALLHQFLTREQRWHLRASRAFPVVAQDGRVYEVHDSGRVVLLADGRAATSYCLHPKERLPSSDLMLAHKLLLETNVEQFLTTANARSLL